MAKIKQDNRKNGELNDMTKAELTAFWAAKTKEFLDNDGEITYCNPRQAYIYGGLNLTS